MKEIKHIFFDLDNTLWDYRKNALIALENLFNEFEIEKKYNCDFDEFYQVYWEINDDLWQRYSDGEVTKDELRIQRFSKTFESLGKPDIELAYAIEEKFYTGVMDNHHLVEGAVEVLEHLKDKYQLHIITNGFKEFSNDKINKSELKGYFETITTAEEAGALKPDSIVFEAGLKKAEAKVEESLYLGDDWVADMVGATEFGMKAIFFNPLGERHSWIVGVPIIQKLVEVKNYL